MSPVLVNFLSLTTMENILISINYSQKLISIRESIRTVGTCEVRAGGTLHTQ